MPYHGALIVTEAQLELRLAGRGILAAHARIARHAAQRGDKLGPLVQAQAVLQLASDRNWTLQSSQHT